MHRDLIARHLADARRALDQALADQALLDGAARAADLLTRAVKSGGKLLICGNGGSACDAAHFAEELTGRFRAPPPGRADRPPIAAIACAEPGHLTCVANDFGFDHVFSRWVEALARPGDVVIVLSTSGKSANILRAMEAGRRRGASTIALLGRDGGPARGCADCELIVPGQTSERIQEIHMLILHALVDAIESALAS